MAALELGLLAEVASSLNAWAEPDWSHEDYVEILKSSWEHAAGIHLLSITLAGHKHVRCTRCQIELCLISFVKKHAPSVCDMHLAIKPYKLGANPLDLSNATGLDKNGAWRLCTSAHEP
jgi:hypothetical protein